jgi:hypothetical protein
LACRGRQARAAGFGSGPLGIEALEHGGQVSAREAPVERSCRSVVAVLEALQAIGQSGEVGEVGRLDDLSLDDREDDLDLVQPGGMHGQVDESGLRPCCRHPVDRPLAIVRGAVVNYPVDASGASVGLEVHDPFDEFHERHDPGLLGHATE